MDTAWLIVLLSALYGGLLALALSEWVRQPRSRCLNRWAWLLIIIIFSLFGPVAYLFLGRARSEG